VGRSKRTVWGWLKAEGVYLEHHQEPTSAGNSVKTTFVDPATLPVQIPHANLPIVEPPGEPVEDSAITNAVTVEEAARVLAVMGDATQRLQLARLAAARFSVSLRTVHRWVKRAERGEEKRRRADNGRPRIPQPAYQMVVAALASNLPETSTRMLHRTLMRAAPQVMTYELNGHRQVVSARTVQRIRNDLRDNPHTALLLSDEDEMKEHVRVWVGEVISEHANDIWELDMTRCDVMVVDPETGKIFRPRVHAIIDVYSGCIPGIVFSQEEDQTQTDLAILRAVIPKSGMFADKYPVWGIPKKFYIDNGKTYRSSHAARITAGLGIQVIHSKPRVSHTRGDIERFFGTLHNFEKSLPGYVGANAAKRGSERLRKITRSTESWLRNGGDLAIGDRLMTINEYQYAVLAWLTVEYHQWQVDGLTRLEHFTSTAPSASLLHIPLEELLLLFTQRVTRKVDGAGRIKLNSRFWTIPDGTLVQYQGYEVVVMRDQFALDPDTVLVAWQDRRGKLELIGAAQPAPDNALSLEAHDQRRAARAVAVEQVRSAREQKKALSDPSLRVPTQLLKQLDVTLAPELPPAARGRLEVVNPPEAIEEFAEDDVIGQAIKARMERRRDGPTDPIERARWISQGRPMGVGEK
jgi:putative transposase